MPNAAFVDDEEIARSIRKITTQRNTKRFAALAGLVLAIVAFVGAIMLSYGDTESERTPSGNGNVETR